MQQAHVLHLKLQPTHIVDVLGGDANHLTRTKTLEESYLMPKAKKKKVVKKKAKKTKKKK